MVMMAHLVQGVMAIAKFTHQKDAGMEVKPVSSMSFSQK